MTKEELEQKTEVVLAGLTPPFRLKCRELLRLCHAEGVTLYPYCGVRTCVEQARTWRAGRSLAEIESQIKEFNAKGLSFLAACITSVGPQSGITKVTNAAPGESWHQYGEAMDCAPFVGGHIDWDVDAPGWAVYGEAAAYLELTWGGKWRTFQDKPHVQLSPSLNPLRELTPQTALAAMTAVKAI